MSIIHVLDDGTINKIAAGEVVAHVRHRVRERQVRHGEQIALRPEVGVADAAEGKQALVVVDLRVFDDGRAAGVAQRGGLGRKRSGPASA